MAKIYVDGEVFNITPILERKALQKAINLPECQIEDINVRAGVDNDHISRSY
jgi:hypothetical protein